MDKNRSRFNIDTYFNFAIGKICPDGHPKFPTPCTDFAIRIGLNGDRA
jgi:hypothetical protein